MFLALHVVLLVNVAVFSWNICTTARASLWLVGVVIFVVLEVAAHFLVMRHVDAMKDTGRLTTEHLWLLYGLGTGHYGVAATRDAMATATPVGPALSSTQGVDPTQHRDDDERLRGAYDLFWYTVTQTRTRSFRQAFVDFLVQRATNEKGPER
jgi:hypothetical protein